MSNDENTNFLPALSHNHNSPFVVRSLELSYAAAKTVDLCTFPHGMNKASYSATKPAAPERSVVSKFTTSIGSLRFATTCCAVLFCWGLRNGFEDWLGSTVSEKDDDCSKLNILSSSLTEQAAKTLSVKTSILVIILLLLLENAISWHCCVVTRNGIQYTPLLRGDSNLHRQTWCL